MIIAVGLAAIVAAIVLISRGSSGEGSYLVRAVFDNASFMVPGEQVRVAGANVGRIAAVEVTMPGEVDSYSHGRPKAVPGKAALVMEITDPGFRDFRADASCLIRPQSLIGEKFVDCRPTLPRAPGSPPAPPLKKIASGRPGAGQYLLPLENNSTSVDPDLINNIQSLPYSQRFRLILNELGAGLAGRGKDIEEVVKRANPVLRDADRLFGILSSQRHRLAQLASDSERILAPLSAQRTHVAGFLSNAGAAGEASSERGAALEASLSKFPRFLHEFRLTMRELKGFSDAASPVFADLGQAAPSLTSATRALTPFAAASTVSLKSLGATGEVAGPKLRAADPIVRKARDLARSGVSPNAKLAEFLNSTRETKGFNHLLDLIYNTAASVNEFDQYGHFVRSLVVLSNCTDYVAEINDSSCVADFGESAFSSASAFDPAAMYRRIQEEMKEQGGEGEEASGGTEAGPGAAAPNAAPRRPASGLGEGKGLGAKALASPPQRALLNYILGP